MKKIFAMLGILLLSAAAHADSYVLKFALLAPQGSAWANIVANWAKQVEQRSGGRLQFRLYPGGVSGDEPDMLRKMRFGQLQGGAFSGHGISYMYSPARVLEIPFLLRNYGEVDDVRTMLMPQIRKGFHDKGFELLGWMETGFVHLFSRKPIYSMSDMRSRRIWLWEGDALGKAFFSAANLSPVPLPITDVLTSLTTGLVDTTMAPPVGAVALQWFTQTPYMTDIPIMDGIGGLIVTRKFFDGLPTDLQALLRETGEQAGQQLIAASRSENEKSLTALKQQGVTFTRDWKDKESDIVAVRDRAAASLAQDDYIPADVYQAALREVQAYRARNGSK